MAGDLKVSNGSTYVTPKTVAVSNGSNYVTAKGVWVSRGDGTWTSAWPTVSTVSLANPTWALSTASGQTSPSAAANTIVSPTFTVTLGNPAAVASVSLQLSYVGGGWVEYKAWTSGITATLTYAIPFSTAGAWQARAVATSTTGVQTVSNITSITCYKKSLIIYANGSTAQITPAVGSTVTFTFACTDDCAPLQSSQELLYTTNGSPWTFYSDPGLDSTWENISGNEHWWMYRERFSDGSVLHSQYVSVLPAAITHYHEVVPSGSSGAAIQAAMDRAYNWFIANKNAPVDFNDENTMACVELQAGGGYNLGGTVLHYRRGVRLFSSGTGDSRAYVRSASVDEDPGGAQTHIMNCDNNGGGGYLSPHYDWRVQGIRFDCMNHSGGITTTHTSRFQIDNCHFWGLGAVKHYLEINSSGGARNDAVFNCRVIANEYGPSPKISGRRTEDECIQLDYSWPGAAPATADDGTVTNNVLVQSCWFHNVPRAVGGHHYQNQGGNAYPKGIHSNILVDSNTFDDVNPNTYGDTPNGATSEGAVRAYVWSNVRITNNTFNSCFQPIDLYIPADAYTGHGDPTYAYIGYNTINNSAYGRYGIYGNAADTTTGTQLYFNQVLIENNNVRGSWSTSADIYFVGCDNTRGALGGVTQGLYIRNNSFAPSNMTVAAQKAYNKYRAINSTNLTGGVITNNTVGDGTVDNS